MILIRLSIRAALILTIVALIGMGAAFGIGSMTPRLQIAYISDRTGDSDIYLMDVRTLGTHRLTGREGVIATDRDVSWSPDGMQMVFSSYQNDNFDLFVMNWDGSEMRQLTRTTPHNESDPMWSPDGTRIAYILIRQGDSPPPMPLLLYVINTDGSTARPLSPVSTTTFSWSPDSTRIAFLQSQDTYSKDLFTVNLALTPDVDSLAQSFYSSPDVDDRLRQWRQTREVEHAAQLQLASLDADITQIPGVVSLVADEFEKEFPVWSLDGTQIAYVSGVGGRNNLYLVSQDGLEIRTIATLADSPAWSVNNMIAYMGFSEVSFQSQSRPGSITINLIPTLKLITLDGTSIIEREGTALYPTWSPDAKQVTVNYFGSTIDIYILDIISGFFRPLIATNAIESYPVWRPE